MELENRRIALSQCGFVELRQTEIVIDSIRTWDTKPVDLYILKILTNLKFLTLLPYEVTRKYFGGPGHYCDLRVNFLTS